MQARVLRQFLNGSKLVREGEVIEVTERRFQDLERNRLVGPVKIGTAMKAPPRSARSTAPPEGRTAVKSDPDPSTSLPPGGQTGEERPARSSSRRGRRRSTRNSVPVEAERVS